MNMIYTMIFGFDFRIDDIAIFVRCRYERFMARYDVHMRDSEYKLDKRI
jgi:hypothetical protein